MRLKVIALATIVTASIAVLSPAQARHPAHHPVLDANGSNVVRSRKTCATAHVASARGQSYSARRHRNWRSGGSYVR
jgi:hypothetical protein